MEDIKSVILIDVNDIDNFINYKILENHGATDVIIFKSSSDALSYLKVTPKIYQLILIDINLPIMDGFVFIDKFRELELHQTHGNICLLSSSINPLHIERSAEKNIKFIEKPLTLEKLFTTLD
jgi:CheY-like chemotaxis protein